jgi:hypothetical protein
MNEQINYLKKKIIPFSTAYKIKYSGINMTKGCKTYTLKLQNTEKEVEESTSKRHPCMFLS